jgi:PAS domain S-box-containing protein
MLPDFRIRQREYLLEISRAITEELDLEKVLNLVVRLATELLSGHAGLIALRQESGGWHVAASSGINPALLKQLRPLLADIPDQKDPARFELPEVNRRLQRMTEAASLGLLTGVGLPMVTRSEVLGVIFVFRSYRGLFSAEDRNLLSGFASQAAIAVQNASLYRDVTRQRQHLASVLESSADGIFILDPGHTVVGFNRACARLTGISAEQAIGSEHSQVIQWARRTHGASLEEAVSSGWPLNPQAALYVEGDLRRKDGATTSVGVTYAPTTAVDGRLLGIVGNVRDISRFREAEELKSTFISIISHELRTPVALIKGYVGTLRREDATWEPDIVRQSLAVIEEEADRLAHLIDDLLEASRLQAGALRLKRSDLALDQLAARAAEKFRTQSDRHNFVVQFPPAFPLVIADEDRIAQVINNLLWNAVKYSPDGGTITLTGQVRADDVVLCTQDEGPGISQQDAPRVFDRFFRASEAARTTKGTGLGLYLAKAVIEAHGGQIWVDESPTQGARLCFSLPRAPTANTANE